MPLSISDVVKGKTDQELMKLLHNIMANTNSAHAGIAHVRKHAVFDEWSFRSEHYKCGVDLKVMPADGVLSAFGYRVGDYGIRDSSKRHRILLLILEAPIPPINDPEYVQSWGAPKSIERINKLSRTLRGLIYGAKNRSKNGVASYANALAQWESDLAIIPKLAVI